MTMSSKRPLTSELLTRVQKWPRQLTPPPHLCSPPLPSHWWDRAASAWWGPAAGPEQAASSTSGANLDLWPQGQSLSEHLSPQLWTEATCPNKTRDLTLVNYWWRENSTAEMFRRGKILEALDYYRDQHVASLCPQQNDCCLCGIPKKTFIRSKTKQSR